MAFQRVAGLADLDEGAALRVEVADLPLCLVRTGPAEVKALHDTCSHQQWSLSDGWVGGNEIECSLHGSVFDLDTGAPTSLPAVKPVPVYACRVDGDDVLVDPDQQDNDAPVPSHW